MNDTPRSATALENAVPTAHRSALVRSALVAGGAATGLVASALTGFALVGLMFPNSSLPGTGGAPLTAAAYMPVAVTVVPETRIARLPDAPAAAPVVAAALAPSEPAAAPAWPDAQPRRTADPAPVATLRDADPRPGTRPIVQTAPPAAIAAATPAATLAPTQVATQAPAPTPHTVVATKGVATEMPEATDLGGTDTAGLGPRRDATAPAEIDVAPDTSTFGPRIAALPPDAATDPETGTTAAPEEFAMLSDEDAATRGGAGLFAGRPAATAGAAGEDLDAITPVTADMRPARRPEGFADQLAAAPAPVPPSLAPSDETVAPVLASAAPATSIRPAPRPELRPEIRSDLHLAAATAAPAAQPAAPAVSAPIGAPTNVVEVSAKRKTGGFFSGGSSSCGRSLARAMPNRRGGATGSAFFAGLADAWGPGRDADVINELARGNMPGFLHDLQPVTFRGQDARGVATEITICVTPDYLALGSDQDYVRVPLGLPAASRIAGAFDMTLPTPRMVDAIYAQANVKLAPEPMTASPQMQSTAYLLRHNATVSAQLRGRGGLIAGHKKDVVMASRMASAPGRVAIYGWHQTNGAPIQPVSTVHGADYADYSHGIRLVSKTAFLNGKAVSLDDLLESSRYAYLLNSDGPVPGPVIRTASR